MAKEDLIGIVTVTYNSGEVLAEFLRCVVAQSHDQFLLFAVDNASSDDTLSLLRGCGDMRLRVIANADNRGVAAGNNQGILAALEAGCSSVLLLNNDTEFDASLFEKLDKELDESRAEMVCPKMMYLDDPSRIWAAGGKFLPWMGYLSVCIGEGEIDRGQYDEARLIDEIPTCCVLIRRDVFDTVGLMDERYFVYLDDSDFMYRAMRKGVKLMYLPSAKLLHKAGGLTGGGESAFAIHYATRNRIFFQIKHFGLIRTMPWLVIRHLSWLLAVVLGRQKMSWYRLKHKAFKSGLEMGHAIVLDR